mgnify:CR=1 FL=1
MSEKKFGEETVQKIAQLARLEINSSDAKVYSEQLSKILGYVDLLSEVDTNNIDPMVYPHVNVELQKRADQVITGPGSAAMLSSSPDQIYDNFKVPQVLGVSKQTEGA